MVLVLFETAAGYAVFKVRNPPPLFSNRTSQVPVSTVIIAWTHNTWLFLYLFSSFPLVHSLLLSLPFTWSTLKCRIGQSRHTCQH